MIEGLGGNAKRVSWIRTYLGMGLSSLLHVSILVVLYKGASEIVEPPIVEPPPVSKIRILSNPHPNPKASPIPKPVVTPPKPKPPVPKKVIPTASKVAPPPEPVATPPPEEVAAEEPGIGGPASYGDDTTGGTIGVGVSNTKGDDYDRSITENWQPLEKLQPEYPQQARLDGIEGYVKFLVDISEEGRVENVELVEASPRGVFERNARKAVLKWKYSPPKKDGRPFRLKGHSITISFSLNEE